jgi:hypothetical protein
MPLVLIIVSVLGSPVARRVVTGLVGMAVGAVAAGLKADHPAAAKALEMGAGVAVLAVGARVAGVPLTAALPGGHQTVEKAAS